MSTTPDQILASAKRLSGCDELTEADTRAIVSRAYYAALHGVDRCFPEEVANNQANSHELIIGKAERFGKSLNPGRTEAKEITRDMYLFKKIRKTADYKIETMFDPICVNTALTLGSSILDNCNHIKQKQLTVQST